MSRYRLHGLFLLALTESPIRSTGVGMMARSKKNAGWKGYRGISKKNQLVAPSCIGGGDALLYHAQWWLNLDRKVKKCKGKKKKPSNVPSLDYYGHLSKAKTPGYKRAEEILKRRADMDGATV